MNPVKCCANLWICYVTKEGLKKWKATAEEKQDEELAQEISEQHQDRISPFRFSMCSIAIGEQVEFFCPSNDHHGELFEVVDDRHLLYNGEPWAMTALAKELLQAKWALAGPKYFKYKGEWLNDIRHRCEE